MNYLPVRLLLLTCFLMLTQVVSGQPFTQKYILAFHRCATPVCGGPANHTVELAESNDAETWTLAPNFPAYQGSVPDVITRGNKLYIFTPGQVRRYDQLANQWEANPVPVSITDSLGNPVQFVDPSAFVDDSGLLCLFFLNATGIIGDPAQCAVPPCTAFFDSATEVAGSEGTQFVLRSGHRMEYITQTNFKPTDPDIFRSGNTYYQYISYGSGTMVYSSNNLHGHYSLIGSLPNGYLTNNQAGVPCGLFKLPEQQFYSYGHRNTANGTEITLAKHNNFLAQAVYQTMFTGSSIGLGNVQVASPGITENSFVATAIQEQSTQNDLQIFPNPTTNTVQICSRDKVNSLVVYDLSGHIINADVKTSDQHTFSISGLANGMYIVQCVTDKPGSLRQKIVVQ